MTKKLRAVGYIRMGAGNQYNTFQIPDQEMKNYICSNEDWSFAGVYCDQTTSDDINNRLALQDIMARARKNEFDVVVVRTMYIISPDEDVFYEIYRELKKHNIKIYFTCSEAYFPTCERENLREKLNEMTSKMGELIYKREKAYEN